MKRSRSGRKLNSVDNSRSWSELPIEVWRMILSLVSFDDQVKFRAVCRDWLDVITTLPEFKDTNCLVLDCCTLTKDDEPVTTILNSQLRFGSMVVGNSLSVAAFPTLTTFYARLGETVTYLDLSRTEKNVNLYFKNDGYSCSDCDLDNFRSIVENLHLFKVLQHLKIDSLKDWLKVATSTSSPFIDSMIIFILRKERANIFTRAIVEGFLDSPNMDVFEQRLFLERHRSLILDKITDNLDRINEELYNGNQLENETVDLIIEQIEKGIAEIDKSIDLSNRINTSVRVLSFSVLFFSNFAAAVFEKMFQLVPNVQELNISGATALFDYDDWNPLLNNFSTKITAIDVNADPNRLDELKKLNLPNVKHLRLIQRENTNRSHSYEETLRHFVDLFPRIELMSFSSFKLPNACFDFISHIRLVIDTEQLQLSSLVEFKNLKSLSIFKFSETPLAQGCFFGHQPTSLKTIKKFEFSNRDDKELSLCCQCLEAFLQSLSNLDILNFTSIVKQNYADIIFKNQPNLKRLKIRNDLQKGSTSFKPDNKWPEMKRLRSLTLAFNKMIGNEDAWCNFGQKLQNLRNFEVEASQGVDLVRLIRSDTRPIMPALLRAQILVSKIKYDKPITKKTVERNGRKIIIEKFSEK